jgi:hypothetical protein
MTTLPGQQLGKGQRITPQPQVEPDAKMMQGYFGCQTGLKAVQGMGPLSRQPKGIEQLLIDALNESFAARPASAASFWTSVPCCVGEEG